MPRWLPVLLMTACVKSPGDARRVDALEQTVVALQQRVEVLEQLTLGPTEAQEAAALQLFTEGRTQVEQLDADGARASFHTIVEQYPNTRAAPSAMRALEEIAVVGQEAGPLDVEAWYGAAGSWSSTATLVVFLESWCPHCQREVPRLETQREAWAARGLELIGLTKLTRSATDETMRAFLADNHITFPVGKERDGVVSERFSVSGVPAAAIVRDGKIVWRGHPATLSSETVDLVLAP